MARRMAFWLARPKNPSDPDSVVFSATVTLPPDPTGADDEPQAPRMGNSAAVPAARVSCVSRRRLGIGFICILPPGSPDILGLGLGSRRSGLAPPAEKTRADHRRGG